MIATIVAISRIGGTCRARHDGGVIVVDAGAGTGTANVDVAALAGPVCMNAEFVNVEVSKGLRCPIVVSMASGNCAAGGRASPTADAIARQNSAAFWKRSPAFFSSACATTASIAGVTCGLIEDGFGAGSFNTFSAIDNMVPLKGRRPVSN